MTTKEIVHAKVLRYVHEIFPSALIDDDQDITFLHDSVKVWISVIDLKYGNQEEFKEFAAKHEFPKFGIFVSGTLLSNVPRSPGLYHWVATQPFTSITSVRLFNHDDGNCSLYVVYSIPADTLDPGELKGAILAVAFNANKLDDELKAKFGGQRFIDKSK